MSNQIVEMGVFVWPILLCSLIIVILSVKKAHALYFIKPDGLISKHESGIDAILFCGGMVVVFGFLGAFLGVSEALKAIAGAVAIDPRLIYQGIRITLSIIIFSLTIFAVSATIWFVLRIRYKKLLSQAM
ncbi:hypothetical protein ACFL6I_07515 [candidate division KSB1 bacterium]